MATAARKHSNTVASSYRCMYFYGEGEKDSTSSMKRNHIHWAIGKFWNTNDDKLIRRGKYTFFPTTFNKVILLCASAKQLLLPLLIVDVVVCGLTLLQCFHSSFHRCLLFAKVGGNHTVTFHLLCCNTKAGPLQHAL